MIIPWEGKQLAKEIEEFLPDSVLESNDTDVWVATRSIDKVCKILRDEPIFGFDLLSAVTAVDYIDHFEMVYHLTSLKNSRNAVLKSRCGWERKDPEVPSVTSVWRGAELQEREVWDLMGIKFIGHPNHKRIMLWEGFPGHPLRKDFVTYDQSVVSVDDKT